MGLLLLKYCLLTLATSGFLVMGDSTDVLSSERVTPLDQTSTTEDLVPDGSTQEPTEISKLPSAESTQQPEATMPLEGRGHNIIKKQETATERHVLSQVKVSFELSKNDLTSLEGPLAAYSKIPQVFGSTSSKIEMVTFVESISMQISPLMKLLKVVGVLYKFISVFFLPSMDDVIQEEFENANQKLDAMSLQLAEVGEQLESSIEFHSWFPTYTEYKFKIMNGEEKLQQTMSELEKATEFSHKLKVAKEYVDYFKNQDIEGAIKNIFRLTGTDSTPTQPNLFQLYNEKHECDIVGLSQFFFAVLSLTFSASKQMSSYSVLTYNNANQAEEKIRIIYDQMYSVKHQYEEQVWFCYETSIRRAREKVQNVMVANPEMTGGQLASEIHRELSALVPWYNWSVASYNQITLPEHTKCDNHQFLTFSHNKRNILFMWEEQDTRNRGCHDIKYVNTFIYFKLCEGCNADALHASENTLSGEMCPNYIKSAAFLPCGLPLRNWIGNATTDFDRHSFLAGGIDNGQNPCQGDPCGGHGSCRPIPYTNRYMCFCHPYFDGVNCQTRYNPDDSLLATEVIASVRSNFSNFIGVPDVIDVYLEIQKFPNQLQDLQENMAALHEFSNILTLYGDGFVKAELIAQKYNQLLSGDLDEEIFAKNLVQLDFNFDHIFWSLKMMIHGNGILISEGLLASLKKSQEAASVCTLSYGTKISRFMKDLLILDEEVTEAQLRFLNWKLHNPDPSEEQNSLEQMKQIRDMAFARQQDYVLHWKENSCPELSADSLVENYCNDTLSYEGLSVTLHCLDEMRPSVPSVMCQRENGTLSWSATPICEYRWSSWTSWSRCSKTCGGGVRSRTRHKLNGETDYQSESCETQECCQQRYWRFECENQQCIPRSSVCDGKLDCADGSDEKTCSYLRDGDTVAFESANGEFMYCCGRDYIFFSHLIGTTSCPGSRLNDYDWERCPQIQFTLNLVTKERPRGPIRFGDEVTIIYRGSGICINCLKNGYHWLLDQSNVCRSRGKYSATRECKTKIFAENRLGPCSGNVRSNCKGQPIHPGDEVYLRQGTYWISSWGVRFWVGRGACSGNLIAPFSIVCSSEQWKIYRQ